MTTRHEGPDAQAVAPEDARAMLLEEQGHRDEVQHARRPVTGPNDQHWSDGDVAVGLLVLVVAVGAVFTMVGLIDTVIFCCHHWRGTAQALFITGCAVVLLVTLRVTRDILR